MNEESFIKERYELTVERIKTIINEETAADKFRDYFRTVAKFILEIDGILKRIQEKPTEHCTLEELKNENQNIYKDVMGEHYEKSYANPSYAASVLGEETGRLLCFLYAEIRGEIAYVYEQKLLYLTICNELFIEIYNCFEGVETPNYKELKDIIYWYVNDYCDVFVADRIEEQLNPECSFAADIIMNSDLTDLRYLYKFGEYISENEWKTAQHLNSLPQETIDRMAETYTEGYRRGFVNAGIDLTKKSVVDIQYTLGFERVIKKAIENFAEMGLRPTLYRAAVNVLTKRQHYKIGFYGASANKQYEYDHRNDQGLFLNKKMVERKLEVMKNTYEQFKKLAEEHAGPAVIQIFGEKPFVPEKNESAITLSEKQESLTVLFGSKSGQLTNQYIRGDERSFTIVAYPAPKIGDAYEEIFNEVIRINTLDSNLYEKVQQVLIDALDRGKYVHILGKDDNITDLKINLCRMSDPQTETIFGNCVADMNIPVGEVYTTPVLEGTDGVLFVSKVYLNGLQYRDLQITFRDGKITDYSCSNFEDEEAGRKYVRENVLFNHDMLPIGEFAIGTNTTAYAMAKKYQIEDKMPILIAEKMGPHFAVGDTCYRWSEDSKVYNRLNGKEVVAKDNSISILRKEDISKAYFQCHTDITIPYEEIAEISVVTKEGSRIPLLKDGRFVLAGTEILNEPLADF